MKVRRAIIKDLKRVQDLYGIVSDEMAGTIYDIMWRRDIYPSKKEIVKDIRHHELYVLEKDNKIIGAMVLNHEYDEWYKEYVSGDTGIWIGNGISDQYLINVNTANKEVINSCGDSFGYVIKQEEPYLIKLLGMKQKGEENGLFRRKNHAICAKK